MRLRYLESVLFEEAEKGKLDLARAALIASGVSKKEILDRYMARIDSLAEKIATEGPLGYGDVERARAIFNWLWKANPQRYAPGGNFRLTQVLDAQLREKEEVVGNCLGLTLLYNVLAQRLGLHPRAVYLDTAFGRGPHVFTLLYTDEGALDIENIFPYGFGYEGHLSHPRRRKWGDVELISEVYVSVGNSLFEEGSLEKAIGSYDKAIALHRYHPTAFFNKGIALAELGRAGEAAWALDSRGGCP